MGFSNNWRSNKVPKGFSLHIGLNSVDPQHYSGWSGDLVACESDAEDMGLIAKSLRYDNTSTLLTTNATIDNFVNEVKKAASSLESGDIFSFLILDTVGVFLINKMMKPTVLTKLGVYMMVNS